MPAEALTILNNFSRQLLAHRLEMPAEAPTILIKSYLQLFDKLANAHVISISRVHKWRRLNTLIIGFTIRLSTLSRKCPKILKLSRPKLNRGVISTGN